MPFRDKEFGTDEEHKGGAIPGDLSSGFEGGSLPNRGDQSIYVPSVLIEIKKFIIMCVYMRVTYIN